MPDALVRSLSPPAYLHSLLRHPAQACLAPYQPLLLHHHHHHLLDSILKKKKSVIMDRLGSPISEETNTLAHRLVLVIPKSRKSVRPRPPDQFNLIPHSTSFLQRRRYFSFPSLHPYKLMPLRAMSFSQERTASSTKREILKPAMWSL